MTKHQWLASFGLALLIIGFIVMPLIPIGSFLIIGGGGWLFGHNLGVYFVTKKGIDDGKK